MIRTFAFLALLAATTVMGYCKCPETLAYARPVVAVSAPAQVEPEIFLKVNYEKPLVDAIKEAGFSWENERNVVEKNFPKKSYETGEQTISAKLFNFGRSMSSKGVVKAMSKDGFRPATLRELLAFAAMKLNEKQKGECKEYYEIVGLGSTWKLHAWKYPSGTEVTRRVPCYTNDVGLLSTAWWGFVWPDHVRFLAVRRKS